MIFDQHACDEITNFEQLLTEYAPKSFRYFNPLRIELEQPVIDLLDTHRDSVERNGWVYDIEDGGVQLIASAQNKTK
jgi:DNA mismatch repair ATPase MutL